MDDTSDQLTPHGAVMMRRRGKYGNVPTSVDGIRFPSKLEAKRWQELRLLERGNVISDLKRQVPFKLYGKGGTRVATYIADFVYQENGQQIVEDTKGVETAAFKLKARLFADNFPDTPLRIIKK